MEISKAAGSLSLPALPSQTGPVSELLCCSCWQPLGNARELMEAPAVHLLCSGQQTLPGILGLCFEEVVEGRESVANHGTNRSVKCCSLLLGLSFGQWTSYGFTDLPRRTESDPESGAPESLKANASFQTGEAEKKEIEKIYLEVVLMTYPMPKAFKEHCSSGVPNFSKRSKDSQ